MEDGNPATIDHTQSLGNHTISPAEEPMEEGNPTVRKMGERWRNPNVTRTTEYHTTLGLQMSKVLKGNLEVKRFDEMRHRLKHATKKQSHNYEIVIYNKLRAQIKTR